METIEDIAYCKNQQAAFIGISFPLLHLSDK